MDPDDYRKTVVPYPKTREELTAWYEERLKEHEGLPESQRKVLRAVLDQRFAEYEMGLRRQS